MRGAIVVTGDSRGLGQEIVKQLYDKTEYNIIGISRSNSNKLLEDYIKSDRYSHIKYDLEVFENIRDLYLKDIKNKGPIVGLVNNSAKAYDDLVTNLNGTQLTNMYKLNVFAPMMLTKYIIRDMLLNKTAGSVVHITSVCAHTGYKGLAMYASSKGALEAYSRTVAREWGANGIRSNCVAPGFMDTEMSNGLSQDQRNRIYLRTSLKKETNILSVAAMVVYLLSDESNSITGQVINIDNGTI